MKSWVFWVISLVFHGLLLLLILGVFNREIRPGLDQDLHPELPLMQASVVVVPKAVSAPKAPPTKTQSPPIPSKIDSQPVTPPSHSEIQKPKAKKPVLIPPKKKHLKDKPTVKKNQETAKQTQEKTEALKALKAQSKQAQEAAERRAKTLQEKYMGLIQSQIRSHWINAFDPLENLSVTLEIRVDEKGRVESVEIAQSSGNPVFDREAVAAVQKASPLPMPEDPALAKDFRQITLPFS